MKNLEGIVKKGVEAIALTGLLAACSGGGSGGNAKPVPTPVNNAPSIVSTPVTQVLEGSDYSYDVNANDDGLPSGNSITYSLSQAPNWLSINSGNGLVTGTAPAVSSNQSFNVQVRASDGEKAGLQSYSIMVENEPEFSPVADFSGYAIPSMVESPHALSEFTINLPTPADDNESDNPVVYSNVTSSNPLVSVSNLREESGTWKVDLTASSEVNQNDSYSLDFTIKSQNEEEVSYNVSGGSLENLFEMSGNFQDVDNDLPLSFGEIRIFGLDGERYIEGIDVDTFVASNSDGEYSVSFREPISDDIVLQFAGTEGMDKTTFVRSLVVDASSQDLEGKLVRAQYLPSYEGEDTNGDGLVNGNDDLDYALHVNKSNIPIKRVDINNLPVVQIIRNSACGDSDSYFTDNQIDSIKDITNDPDFGAAYIEGRTVDVEVYPDDGGIPGYSVDEDSCDSVLLDGSEVGLVNPDDGYIIIHPTDMTRQGLAIEKSKNTWDVVGGQILIKSVNPDEDFDYNSQNFKRLVAHEEGHIYTTQNGHPNILPNNKTNMNSAFGASAPTYADKKTGSLVYEMSYKTGEGVFGVNGDSVNSFLETKYLDE